MKLLSRKDKFFSKESRWSMASVGRRITCCIVLVVSLLAHAIAGDLPVSGKNDILDNPFIAYGVNLGTKEITGYLVGLRTSPGRTDECKFVFAGNLSNERDFSVKYLSENDGYEKSGSMSAAVVQNVHGDLQIRIKKDQMGGDCDWILGFTDELRVRESDGEVAVSVGELIPGDWIGVYAIGSKRASFYRTTDESSVQRAYLAKGDLIYVFDQKPGWYYVKYQGRKRMTAGWIRKSDTVQIR